MLIAKEKFRLLFSRTVHFRLVPTPEDRKTIAGQIMNPSRFRRFINRHRLTPYQHYPESVARISEDFTTESIKFLMRLRTMGHVYVGDAARVFGLPDADAFVERTINNRTHCYIRFMPMFDGRMGVLVPFDRLMIDLRPV